MRDIDINRNNTDKSLIKSATNFKEAREVYYGGTHGSKGKFFKASKTKGAPHKPYYLANRFSYQEYFAFEILNAIGFSTPKARFIDSKESTIEIATKAIDNYMPLAAYCNWWPRSAFLRDTPEVRAIKRKYVLDATKQIVLDKKINKSIKISGNLFAADLGAYLLQDSDLSAEGTNLALIKKRRSLLFLLHR